jgi:hypothetical protein
MAPTTTLIEVQQGFNWTVGQLKMPFHVHAEGRFVYKDVRVSYTADPFGYLPVKLNPREMKAIATVAETTPGGTPTFYEKDAIVKLDEWDADLILPPDMAAYKDALVKQKKEDCEKRKAPFFNGRQIGMRGADARPVDGTERMVLYLDLAPSFFFTYAATNQALDKQILDDGSGNKMSIRQKYIRDPTDWNDCLANSTGVSMVLISKPDNEMTFVKRSEKLAQYPGRWGVAAAGFMNRDAVFDKQGNLIKINRDCVAGVPNPLLTGRHELKEEMGVECDFNDIVLFGVGRPLDDLHGEIWGEYRTDMTSEQIRSTKKSNKFEHLKLVQVPFEPRKVLEYLINPELCLNPYENWVPAHAVATVDSLINEFGDQEVLDAIAELHGKHHNRPVEIIAKNEQ